MTKMQESHEEIQENDYNLNIPRYADTFEEEEPVDIEATKKEIVMIEDGKVELSATVENETIWLSQKQMELLFWKRKKCYFQAH